MNGFSVLVRRTGIGVLGLVATLVVAGSARAQSSVVFDGFDAERATSDFRVTFLGGTPAADQDGPGGFAAWTQWCYRVTSLQNTQCCPGEFTHLSFGVPDIAPHNQVEALILASMVVSADNGDYSTNFRSTVSGPLPMRGAEWNNVGDHLLAQNESADFCFTTPTVAVGRIQVGMKVGSVRQFAMINGPGTPSAPAPALGLWMMVFIAGCLLATGFLKLRVRRMPADAFGSTL